MKLTAAREDFLTPLQSVIGVVERAQTMPILANVLLSVREDRLSVTGSDLEVELVASRQVAGQQTGDVTIPGRKLLDIFRALPEKTAVTLSAEGDRVNIRAGPSRFALSSLPASEFPVVDDINAQQTLTISQADLRKLIDKTHFAMAQQDVRYYLNGMLLETDGKTLRAVATDGHRLAICEMDLKDGGKSGQHQVIVPRKGVLELQRILGTEGAIELAIGTNHVRAQIGEIRFTSKLIDGGFPEYGRVVPANPGKKVEADREALRAALQRTAILSNEKYRGIRLTARPDLLVIQAHNPEQEEAEDQVEVDYKGDEVEIGLTDANSSCLIHAPGTVQTRYVVMPMRL